MVDTIPAMVDTCARVCDDRHMRADYQHRRNHGLCVRCGALAEPGRCRCATCAADHAEERRIKRTPTATHRIAVLPRHPGTCEECQTHATRRERFAGRWLCLTCLNPDIVDGRAETTPQCALGWAL